MGNRILIAGSEGFIGSHLKEKLPNADCIDLKLGQDIRTYKFTEKYDIIYHVAAKASIPHSFENPIESHSHNVMGTLRILEHARKTGAKVVFSSSSSVYEMMSPYAVQKKQVEDYLKLYWTLGVKSVALRYFNVFGERQEIANGGYALVLAKFLNQKKYGLPLTIVGTGEQRRDFVYVGDVVDANIRAGEWLDNATEFQVFDVGSGENISINEMADIIGGAREMLPPRQEPFSNKADKNKFLPNWQPKVKLLDWLKL